LGLDKEKATQGGFSILEQGYSLVSVSSSTTFSGGRVTLAGAIYPLSLGSMP
jgi:hypothetical protein